MFVVQNKNAQTAVALQGVSPSARVPGRQRSYKRLAVGFFSQHFDENFVLDLLG